MLGLFRKKNKSQTLQKEYDELMQECYRLSSINQLQSDMRFAKAQGIAVKIQELKNSEF